MSDVKMDARLPARLADMVEMFTELKRAELASTVAHATEVIASLAARVEELEAECKRMNTAWQHTSTILGGVLDEREALAAHVAELEEARVVPVAQYRSIFGGIAFRRYLGGRYDRGAQEGVRKPDGFVNAIAYGTWMAADKESKDD